VGVGAGEAAEVDYGARAAGSESETQLDERFHGDEA